MKKQFFLILAMSVLSAAAMDELDEKFKNITIRKKSREPKKQDYADNIYVIEAAAYIHGEHSEKEKEKKEWMKLTAVQKLLLWKNKKNNRKFNEDDINAAIELTKRTIYPKPEFYVYNDRFEKQRVQNLSKALGELAKRNDVISAYNEEKPNIMHRMKNELNQNNETVQLMKEDLLKTIDNEDNVYKGLNGSNKKTHL